jgi:hypothetical protein
MSEAIKHTGGCHCGKVRYEVKIDLERPAITCNCSMCGRAGTYLSFVPAADFTLLSGEDALVDYQFNKKHIHHLFCGICGIKSFARGTGRDGTPTIAVNVRCLDSAELDKVKLTAWNGKAT